MTGADRRKLNKDAGFSLLELLIAVVILAIIVIPLLNLFLSSNRLNIKSRQTLRATTLAQDIMEGLKAYDIEELKAQFNNPTDGFYVINDSLIKGKISEEAGMEALEVNPSTGTPDDGIYYFSLRKVAMQGSEFDALVKVDAREYMEPGPHNNAYNGDPLVLNKGIGDARSIDKKNGTFVEEDKYRQAMLQSVWPNDPDSTPLKDALMADGITKDDFDKITFKNLADMFTGVRRTITVTLAKSTEVDEDGSAMVDMSVTEEYEFMYQGTGYTTKGDMSSLIWIEDMGCGVISAKEANVNIFYYPLYGNGAIDEIVIKKKSDVNIDFLNLLIAKQIPTVQVNADEVLTDAQLMKSEMIYQADVVVKDGSSHMDKEKFSLKTNLGTNLAGKTYMAAEGKSVDTPGQLTLNGTTMDLSGTSQMNIYTLDGVRSPMGAAAADGEVTELFYNVEVSVYREGAADKGFPEEERMIVIEGSKNN